MALLQKILVPLLAVNDTSLTVVEMNFLNGQYVKKGDHIMVFETSKTTYDVAAETDGYIQYLCEMDKDYEVNEIVAKIFSEENEVEKITVSPILQHAITAKAEHVALETVAVWEGETLFSAEAIQLIDSSGISRSIFNKKDFVSRKDVEAILGIGGKETVRPSRIGMTVENKKKEVLPVDAAKAIVEKLSSNKKREIEYLSEVQSTGLTSTINTNVETEGIFTHINQSLKYLKNSLLPVIIYETSRLLKKYPLLNGYYTGEAIALYKQANVGFAIDIDKGLKVLKIAGADEKSMGEIEEEVMRLSNDYLDESLKIEDLTDVTFTITDLSSEGVAFFRPLVNMMNSAILGVSAIDEKLQRCTLSLTFDHRVTEGKLVAQFLSELKQRLESYQSRYYPHLNQDISCFKCYKTLKEDLGGTGFAKCITPEGKEAYICQSCLKGF
jgi:pyruvate/2-oxoglutarate dehydrogenase complex dihydrolipoamide acyltransferase (E2) component